MDKIIGCSDDELVVKILSFLPTKVAVSTSVLSKRWKFLWMRVTKFDYDEFDLICRNGYEIVETMRRFVMNLPLYSSPVIESLILKLHTATFQHDDIRLLVETVLTRHVREISIENSTRRGKLHTTLQSSLYTCKSLVTLKLQKMILVDVPYVVCLPSLKTLHLQRVKYADEESLQRLLSNCPVLGDLVVKLGLRDNVRKLAVSHPTLLSFAISSDSYIHDEYVIDTPSLKYFKATKFSRSSSFIVNMPKVEKADIHFNEFSDIKELLEPVTSVKHLSLSIIYYSGEPVYGDDIVFNELEHLKIHIVYKSGSNLLLWLLRCSPKLRDVEFSGRFPQYGIIDTSTFWKQLNYVPQCLLSSLQTFKWSCNDPKTEERDLGTYILRNSCQLKTARFSTWPYSDPHKKLERSSMKEEFLASSLGSSTCDLLFDNFDFEGSKELVFSY